MPKKILFFIESLEVGGAEKSLATLLNTCKFQDFSVDLMLLTPGAFLNEIPSHINVIVLKRLKASFLKRLKFYILKKINIGELHSSQFFWKVFKNDFTMIDKQYDIAIAYSQGFSTYFIADKVKAQSKYSWVNIDYKKAGYNMKFDFSFYNRYNKVIAVSEDVKKGITQELSNIGESFPVEVIKDITDINVVRKKALSQLKVNFDHKAINIVTVCRLEKQKGLFLAVESCAWLKEKKYPIKWYVIGEGSERKNLQQLIMKNKLHDSFFLLGADSNPYPYMEGCNIYVQTSLFEGLGLTVVEASYLNKPIVCTNFPTAFDILEDEKTGLIAKMNAADIASKVERLILDKSFRLSLSNNLRKKENRDHEVSIQQIEQLLR
ncbi:glycosyltransferase [Kaistella pullorum]|uniref:Glycosyltransferase n=1 Tax=Kaistella pullorum TaxID=2763074 RepID=A0ABR8WIV9_9FLAO|nr:glycosyltransferase [Kaistella pullorum]MBD8016997.1 glycosyltransferase [Kaistella pullorum]